MIYLVKMWCFIDFPVRKLWKNQRVSPHFVFVDILLVSLLKSPSKALMGRLHERNHISKPEINRCSIWIIMDNNDH